RPRPATTLVERFMLSPCRSNRAYHASRARRPGAARRPRASSFARETRAPLCYHAGFPQHSWMPLPAEAGMNPRTTDATGAASSAEVRAKHKEFLFPAVTNYYEESVVLDSGRSEEHTSELQSRFDLVC